METAKPGSSAGSRKESLGFDRRPVCITGNTGGDLSRSSSSSSGDASQMHKKSARESETEPTLKKSSSIVIADECRQFPVVCGVVGSCGSSIPGLSIQASLRPSGGASARASASTDTSANECDDAHPRGSRHAGPSAESRHAGPSAA